MKLKANYSLLNITFYASVLSLLLFLILRLLLVYSFASDIGGVENNVIYSIAKVLAGGTLYDNPEANNFNITQYAPIYYYLVIFVTKLFNLNPISHLHDIYITGRYVSLFFNLISVYLIYRLLTKNFYCEKKLSLIAGIIFFIHLTRIHFAARPDALFGMVFILILICFVKYFQSNGQNQVVFIVGILLTAISIFIKQTGIQFLIIIPAYFFLIKSYKNFFISAVLLFVFSIISYGVFNLLYGSYFFSNTVSGINNGVSIARIYDVFSHFFLKYQVLFILGLVVAAQFFDTKQDKEIRFIAFMSIGIFCFAFVTSMKEGSWINYYNEFIIAAIILTAIMFERISKSMTQNDHMHRIAKIICAVFIVLLLPNVIVQKLYHEHFQHLKESSILYANKQKVAQLLESKLLNNQYFLSFDDQINAMLPQKSVVPNKDLVPSQSKFNYQNFTKNFNNGNIRLIVKYSGSSVSTFMGCNFSNFKEIYKDDTFTIYETNLTDLH